MTKSRYPYAPDEFDAPAQQGAPVGVHRTPRSGWSKTWPFLLVAVVFAGLAYGGVALLSDNGATENPPQAQSTEPAAEETEAPPAEETEEPPAEEESPATEEPPVEETPAAPDLATLMAAADPSAYVRVLNDGGPEGESRVGKDALEAQGFTNVQFASYPDGGSGQEANTVWYVPNRNDTAAAVAAALGIPAENVEEVPSLREGDVVVVVKSALAPVG
ncbi:LytR C-terminal domain-containing protein [Cellulosimicrobium cellulans]|uniref:LytR C-terminal domain-containing protein n=1 Tax=Cellulosimicrobium cellulans TaxID=1710 RepID=UPI0036EC5D81